MTYILKTPVYLSNEQGSNLGHIPLSEAIQRVETGEFEIINNHQVRVRSTISQIINVIYSMHNLDVIGWLLEFEIDLPDNPYCLRQALLNACLDGPSKTTQIIQPEGN